jgi:hypothetical protein
MGRFLEDVWRVWRMLEGEGMDNWRVERKEL